MASRLFGWVRKVHPQSPYVWVNVPQRHDIPLSLKAQRGGISINPVEGDVVEVKETGGGYKGWTVIRVFREEEPMARVHVNSFKHRAYSPEELKPGTLVWMPGDYVGIVTDRGTVMSLSNPSWDRSSITVRPFTHGETVTLEQVL